MSFIAGLQSMIENRWLDSVKTFIEETDIAATCRRVDFTFNDLHAMFSDNPRGPQPYLFHFFKSIRHLKKFCDSIIFLEEDGNNDVYILCCELKSSTSTNPNSDTLMQLRASELFARFLIETFQRINPSITINPKFRCILFNNKVSLKHHLKPGSPRYVVEGDVQKFLLEKGNSTYRIEEFCCD